MIMKGDLRDTGDSAAVGIAVLKAQHIHQVVGRIADHINGKRHVPDLPQRFQNLRAHPFNLIVFHRLKKRVGSKVVRQAVVFLFVEVDCFLFCDIYDRHTRIPGFVIIEPAPVEAVLRIDGVHRRLPISPEDDTTPPIREHITPARLGNPGHAVPPVVDVVAVIEPQLLRSVRKGAEIPRGHGQLQTAGGAGEGKNLIGRS